MKTSLLRPVDIAGRIGRLARVLLLLLLPALPATAAPVDDLLAAIRAGDTQAAERALDQGAPVNAADDWGRTPLLTATQLRKTDLVKLLVARKADLDAANRNDITPLIAAAQTGNEEAVRVLVAAGAGLDRRDNLGWTALMWASSRNRDAIVKILVDAGASTAKEAGPGARRDVASLPRLAPVPDPERIARGKPDAPITIYEFTDLQCPYCAHGAKVLDEVLARYPDRVKVVVKHLPLPALHPMARPAAIHFEAIAMQDGAKAWAFYDRIFRDQRALAGGEAYLRKVAAEVGADMKTLERDIALGAPERRVDADLREGARNRLDGVPLFVVGGRVIEGAQPVQAFVDVIEAMPRS